jgi:hypothetical protein
MASILAVDPGAEHCGLAVFKDGACCYVADKQPTDLFDWFAVGAALWGNAKLKYDVVVVEAFRLYPGAAGAQTWSAFGTVEVIGVLREKCRAAGTPFVVQAAAVKKPTAAVLKARGVKLRSHGKGSHAKDAELHGWHYVLSQ